MKKEVEALYLSGFWFHHLVRLLSRWLLNLEEERKEMNYVHTDWDGHKKGHVQRDSSNGHDPDPEAEKSASFHFSQTCFDVSD